MLLQNTMFCKLKKSVLPLEVSSDSLYTISRRNFVNGQNFLNFTLFSQSSIQIRTISDNIPTSNYGMKDNCLHWSQMAS